MKRTVIILILLVAGVAYLNGQGRVMPNKPYLMLNSRPGYLTVNEFTMGFGLAETDAPYAKIYYGFTSIHGYQIDQTFVMGGGTGLLIHPDGPLIPLFIDLRARYWVSNITLYAFGDGGFLIDPKDIRSSKMFINAGPGVRFAASPILALNFSPGLLIQMGPSIRSSFINFKLGVTYKPR